MADDYSDERFDPALGKCGPLELLFDGSTLKMSGGSLSYSYLAASGKPGPGGGFDYSKAS